MRRSGMLSGDPPFLECLGLEVEIALAVSQRYRVIPADSDTRTGGITVDPNLCCRGIA